MAIARDTNGFNSTGGAGETTNTLALTLGAGTTLLVAWFVSRGSGDILSGVTWNGTPMTFFAKLGPYSTGEPGNTYGYIYYMLSPASGPHNMVATFASAGDNTWLSGASYTGTVTSGFADNSSGAITATVSPVSTSITPVASGAWGLFFLGTNGTPGAGTNCTRLSASGIYIYDTNGPISGATTIGAAFSGTGGLTVFGEIITIAPPISFLASPNVLQTRQAVKRASFY
jgi:hypothetical protein